MYKQNKKSMKKKIVALSSVAVLALSAIAAGAFFTDKETQTVQANAGTFGIGVVDSSNLDSDNDTIINPGDTGTVAFTITNEGEKSADLQAVIKVKSDVPMTEDAYEYSLSQDDTGVAPVANEDKTELTYTIDLGTVNGSIETEDSVDTTEASGSYEFQFAKAANNDFQDSTVEVEYTIYAKQHRNTDTGDWANADTVFEHVESLQ